MEFLAGTTDGKTSVKPSCWAPLDAVTNGKTLISRNLRVARFNVSCNLEMQRAVSSAAIDHINKY